LPASNPHRNEEEGVMGARWGWALIGGVAAGALAVGIAAMVDDGASPVAAQTTTPTTGGEGSSAPRTVTVSASGTASGTPDTAVVQLGVQTQAAKANDALDLANENAQQLLDALKVSGVEKKDITTTNVSLYPQYSNDGKTITGYQASNTVMVKIRDVAKTGAIMDAAAGVVGDEITLQGVSFVIDDTGALRDAARQDAVGKAKAQADQLAAAAGLEVGKVLALTEGSTGSVPPMPYAEAAGGARDAASVPIEPGQQELDVSVTVVYELTD
jgi:uncharacterized protein YggE